MALKGTLYIERIKDIIGELMASCQKGMKYELYSQIFPVISLMIQLWVSLIIRHFMELFLMIYGIITVILLEGWAKILLIIIIYHLIIIAKVTTKCKGKYDKKKSLILSPT